MLCYDQVIIYICYHEHFTSFRYLSRFRHSEATSRNERKLKNKTLEGKFWWLQDGQSAGNLTLV